MILHNAPYIIQSFIAVIDKTPGELLLVCDGGGQTQYIFEKPKNILNLRHFLGPKNILVASWYMKTKGFIAFLATALQHLGEKLSLAFNFVNFSH